MKVKIKGLDPTGVVAEESEFEIPLIDKKSYGNERDVLLPNGIVLEFESMIQNRYMLEIGEYKYWLKRDGELIRNDNHD